MANIQLKRGQETQVDVTYIATGDTNAFNFSSGYTASLVIRHKAGKSFEGSIVDTLTSAAGRVTFSHANPGPNIQLKWSTAQSAALPNEATTVFGDLKITKTSESEVKHSFRLAFDILPEII